MKNILSLQNKLTPDDFAPLDENYFKEESLETEEIGYWKASWIRLKSNKIAMVALVLIVIMFIFAFVGPLLSPYSYDQQVRGDEALWPCLKHPFGTDRLGRDILVRCMIGTRISMIVGLVSAVIVMIVGSIYGAISGLIGGKVDIVMMRVVDIIYSVPEILLIVVIKMVISEPLQNLIDTVPMFHGLQKIGSGLIAIFIVYGCLYWVGMARIVRGQILQLKTLDFVTAAEALGCGRATMIKEHLLPNCIGQLIATVMLQIPSAIFTEAFLSYLGIGVSAPMASLGSLTSEALNGITTYPYRVIFPAALISLIILSFNLFGDGLRDALDPKNSREHKQNEKAEAAKAAIVRSAGLWLVLSTEAQIYTLSRVYITSDHILKEEDDYEKNEQNRIPGNGSSSGSSFSFHERQRRRRGQNRDRHHRRR